MFHPENSTIHVGKCALPKANMAPENHWLEVGRLLSIWEGLFSGAMSALGIVPYMDLMGYWSNSPDRFVCKLTNWDGTFDLHVLRFV